MWLRDTLPRDIIDEGSKKPMARIMTYGYESGVVESSSFQDIEDLGTMLHQSLRSLAASRMRPIILIAHSLGGIILKQVGRP